MWQTSVLVEILAPQTALVFLQPVRVCSRMFKYLKGLADHFLKFEGGALGVELE